MLLLLLWLLLLLQLLVSYTTAGNDASATASTATVHNNTASTATAATANDTEDSVGTTDSATAVSCYCSCHYLFPDTTAVNFSVLLLHQIHLIHGWNAERVLYFFCEVSHCELFYLRTMINLSLVVKYYY